MNVHISYKAGKTPDVESEFHHQLEKLQRRLQVFKPELVHFHANIEMENGQRAKATLNLRLPSGQIAAQKSAENILAAVKSSFADLVSQVNKHKELLRGHWNWQRRSSRGKRQDAAAIAWEHITASVPPADLPPQAAPDQAAPDNDGINNWINANLEQLERFVDRELRYRLATGEIRDGQITREEVIDEVIVSALSREEGRPDDLSLDTWLYRLALRAMRRVAQANADTASVSLDAPAGVPNVTGSDENVLQYHQPDDSLPEESIIRDLNVRTPEEIFASQETVAQLDSVLHAINAPEREVFVLFALEGFTVEEIARITDLPSDRIRRFIHHARERIQRHLPPENELRQQLLHRSRVA
jgi:RNA polymerase sigma-70 factor (ECF subfamily)